MYFIVIVIVNTNNIKQTHKKNTHTHPSYPPPHTYRNDLTDDVNEAVQLMYTTPYKYTV